MPAAQNGPTPGLPVRSVQDPIAVLGYFPDNRGPDGGQVTPGICHGSTWQDLWKTVLQKCALRSLGRFLFLLSAGAYERINVLMDNVKAAFFFEVNDFHLGLLSIFFVLFFTIARVLSKLQKTGKAGSFHLALSPAQP